MNMKRGVSVALVALLALAADVVQAGMYMWLRMCVVVNTLVTALSFSCGCRSRE